MTFSERSLALLGMTEALLGMTEALTEALLEMKDALLEASMMDCKVYDIILVNHFTY